MKSGTTIIADKLNSLQKSLAIVTQTQVLVGIPDKNAEREPDPDEKLIMNNASIGYLQENGLPEQNIPARPFLIPGVESVQDKTIASFKSALISSLSDDMAGFNRKMNEAGIVAADAVRTKIDEGPFALLSDATLRNRARKAAKSAGTKAERKIAQLALASGDYSQIDAQPLIDTGQLLKAITYTIRKP